MRSMGLRKCLLQTIIPGSQVLRFQVRLEKKLSILFLVSQGKE